jgi:two-component system NtrC family sensor kinase
LTERLAATANRLVLLEDRAGLQRLLEDTRESDPLCDYALIVSAGGEVLASTFSQGVPVGLAEIEVREDERSVIVSDRGTLYLDVAAPLLEGELGAVRIGARMERIQAGVATVRLSVIVMVAAFLVLGLRGAYLTAHVIASPVERLAQWARTFDPAEPARPAGELGPATGEVGDLVRSFEAMAARLRQLYQQRQAFQERIVRAERLATVGALAAGIAHDVNNPLAGLRNCLRAVAREPEDIEQTRSYAEMMIDATRSIERAVHSLIDVAARSQPEPASVDVRSLIERTVMLVRPRFQGRQVHIETDIPEDLAALQTDEGLLQQVLVNLLINACDASAAGDVVTVSAHEREDALVFEVADRGTGISPEIVDRLFQPFVTTKEDQGGTGLGLAMVQTLVSDLGGEVSFDTSRDVGTCFSVVLPLEADDEIVPDLPADLGE